MRVAATFALCLAAAVPLTAQTVVTPTSPAGWIFYNGGSTGNAGMITGNHPIDGNGSLELNVTTGSDQPAALFGLTTPVSLTSLSALSFTYFTDAAQVSAPTLRFFVSGLGNTGGLTTGSFGLIGTSTGLTSLASTQSSGNYFFRVTSKGQAADGCSNTSYAGSFGDREQALSSWELSCDGVGSDISLANAMITGFEIDYGTFPGLTTPTVDYADDVSWTINGATQSFNFETDAAPVPEPGTLSLLATGLVGLAGVGMRKRRK